jgi:hypothetical protein
VLRLGYADEGGGAVLGVERDYVRGGSKQVVRLDLKTGVVLGYIAITDAVDGCFCFSGKALLTTEYDLIDTTLRAPWSKSIGPP